MTSSRERESGRYKGSERERVNERGKRGSKRERERDRERKLEWYCIPSVHLVCPILCRRESCSHIFIPHIHTHTHVNKYTHTQAARSQVKLTT